MANLVKSGPCHEFTRWPGASHSFAASVFPICSTGIIILHAARRTLRKTLRKRREGGLGPPSVQLQNLTHTHTPLMCAAPKCKGPPLETRAHFLCTVATLQESKDWLGSMLHCQLHPPDREASQTTPPPPAAESMHRTMRAW